MKEFALANHNGGSGKVDSDKNNKKITVTFCSKYSRTLTFSELAHP
jgi:hypothetical protein